MNRRRHIGAIAASALLLLAAASCKTTGRDDLAADPAAGKPAVEFIPTSFIAPIQFAKGQYPDLFAATSQAVWSGPELIEYRKNLSRQSGQPIDARLEKAAETIHSQFLVYECNLVSAFADMSIGYDAVGLRGATVYLLTSDGRRIDPVQIIPGSVREQPKEALREYTRTILIVFPKQTAGAGAIDNATAIQLVIEKVGSTFFFQWSSSVPPTESWMDKQRDKLQVVKVGFTDLYGTLARTLHVFD